MSMSNRSYGKYAPDFVVLTEKTHAVLAKGGKHLQPKAVTSDKKLVCFYCVHKCLRKYNF